MPGKTEQLSNIDAAWLGMDDPTNLMMITGVMTFKKPIDMDHLMAVVNYRWLKFDRFKQRVVKSRRPGGMPSWEDDPHFDIRAHIRRVALPAPGDQNALQEMVSDLMSTPLDPSKPLWQMHVVENVAGGSAIISRLHHCIADGMALVYVLLSMTDMTPDAPWPQPVESDETGKKGGRSLGLGTLVRGTRWAARTTGRISGQVVRSSWGTVNNPNRALEVLQSGADVSYAASRLLLYTPDPETPFKGELGVTKRGAWSRPLPLKDVKKIKKVTHTTVNDVLVSAMTGAVRNYLVEKGIEPEDFRAVIPVNMRKPQEMQQMGNKFGLVFLSLPVSIADPMARLVEVNRRMTALKDSAEAFVSLNILNVMGFSTSEIQSLILKIFASKATTVFTNVPGPPMPLFLAGSEIDNMMFWVPQSGRLGIGISILSYAGKVYLGVATDAGLVPDPNEIIDGFYPEFEKLFDILELQPSQKPTEANNAQPVKTSTRVDDLTKVNGIGPKVADLLYKEGISSYEQLGNTSVDVLQELLVQAGGRYQQMDPSKWSTQARYLASFH